MHKLVNILVIKEASCNAGGGGGKNQSGNGFSLNIKARAIHACLPNHEGATDNILKGRHMRLRSGEEPDIQMLEVSAR